MKKLPTTLLLIISTENIILTMQHNKQQNLSENMLNRIIKQQYFYYM